MLLNRYLTIKINVDWATFSDILIALCFCMVHSVVNNSGAEKKQLLFLIYFSKLFSRGGWMPTLHLKTFNIFFSGPDFWKIYRSVGLTASTWQDETSTHRDIFLKSGSEKNLLKTFNSLSRTFGFFSGSPRRWWDPKGRTQNTELTQTNLEGKIKSSYT